MDRRVGWIVMAMVGSVGGWLCGRGLGEWSEGASVAAKPAVPPRRVAEVRARVEGTAWLGRVKAAKPGDFPGLLDEWKREFADPDRFSALRENTLRLILGHWWARDPEGFGSAFNRPDFWFHDEAGALLGEMLADDEIDRVLGDGFEGNLSVCEQVNWALLQRDPALALKYNRLDSKGLSRNFNEHVWRAAIAELAKRNARAAGELCVACTVPHFAEIQAAGLREVVRHWQGDDASLREWIDSLQDPYLRRLAGDARLAELAGRDPQAAFAELVQSKLGFNGNGPKAVLVEMAKTDLPQVLGVLDGLLEAEKQEIENRGRGLPSETSSDLLDETRLQMSVYQLEEEVGKALAASLPDDPREFMQKLQALRAQSGGLGGQFDRLSASILSTKAESWTADECLTAAAAWGASAGGEAAGSQLRALARQAALRNPELVAARLEELPEDSRGMFARELLVTQPQDKLARSSGLVVLLRPDDWNWDLGKSLARNPEAFAGALAASLPEPEWSERGSSGSPRAAREKFVGEWLKTDPEAAGAWLASVPAATGPEHFSDKFAGDWAYFDPAGAAGWVSTLPEGRLREISVKGLAGRLCESGDAAQGLLWVQEVKDARERMMFLNRLRESSKVLPDRFSAVEAETRKELQARGYE